MTSLDDRLRHLFLSGSPAPDELQGDVRQVRAEVRHRRLRRRALSGAVAAAVVVVVGGGGLLLADRDRDDDVMITETTTTDADPSTTTSTTTGTTTATAPSTDPPTSVPTPQVSIRDVDLGAATFTEACAGFGDRRTATLDGGAARLPDDGYFYEVSLGPVGYADADGDGDDDAVVVLRCVFAGGSTDSNAQLRAYGVGDDGRLAQIGASQLLEHDGEATVDGLTSTVTRLVFGPDDAACCPSSAVREVWRFDGGRFQLIDSTSLPPPAAGG